MISKLILAGAAILAVTPAIAMLFWPSAGEQVSSRSVALRGPILGFSQTRDHIQVRLTPPVTEAERTARLAVIVKDKDGDELAIPLKRGQLWASAKLPENISSASALEISVR